MLASNGKNPLHIKINEPALIGTFSSIPEFYNVSDGMQAYASYEFHQRFSFIYGNPTKKGHYETIVTSHKNGGSLYFNFTTNYSGIGTIPKLIKNVIYSD